VSDKRSPNVVLINKYPNRRFYDTLNSRHVTLQEIHDLIVSGKDVCVTDTATGDDLTNIVLMQILLERDHLKLDLFPSSVMHMMIRASRNTLRTTVERFFGPFLGIMAASQKQFDSYLRDTMKNQMISPLDWTKGMFNAFGVEGSSGGRSTDYPSQSEKTHSVAPMEGGELDELRAQMDMLQRRISDLATPQRPNRKPSKKRPARKPKARK
jgi:polyhydroxyalkanoate synthesis repressor PhaR